MPISASRPAISAMSAPMNKGHASSSLDMPVTALAGVGVKVAEQLAQLGFQQQSTLPIQPTPEQLASLGIDVGTLPLTQAQTPLKPQAMPIKSETVQQPQVGLEQQRTGEFEIRRREGSLLPERVELTPEEVIQRNMSILENRFKFGGKVQIIPRVGFDVKASCGMFV